MTVKPTCHNSTNTTYGFMKQMYDTVDEINVRVVVVETTYRNLNQTYYGFISRKCGTV